MFMLSQFSSSLQRRLARLFIDSFIQKIDLDQADMNNGIFKLTQIPGRPSACSQPAKVDPCAPRPPLHATHIPPKPL
uniref:Uncharacterized protein n=1 Tax=Arundo donax TaxID=35708 RepID=A0A0A9C8S5_ARUDO